MEVILSMEACVRINKKENESDHPGPKLPISKISFMAEKKCILEVTVG